MTSAETVEAHYAQESLAERIRLALEAMGRSDIDVDALAPVDEFHIGGRPATEAFLDPLGLAAGTRVLDLGSGIGGTARFVASRYGADVVGIDLTAAYVDAARQLSDWVGLSDRVRFECGSVLDLPFDSASFDAAVMLHVGMNIADKQALAEGVARVLRPGKCFAIYDVMEVGAGALAYPVPWATTPQQSAVATPEAYEAALSAAGFEVVAKRNRSEEALAFFEKLRANLAGGAPPPLGLHILMGPEAATKVGNVMEAIRTGYLAPVELIGRLPE